VRPIFEGSVESSAEEELNDDSVTKASNGFTGAVITTPLSEPEENHIKVKLISSQHAGGRRANNLANAINSVKSIFETKKDRNLVSIDEENSILDSSKEQSIISAKKAKQAKND